MSSTFKPEGEFGYSTRWLFFIVFCIIVLSIVGYLGMYTNVFVERKVFEQSYQYKAGMEQQSAVWQASIAEIDRKITDPNLTATERNNLEAQRSALNIQLNAIIRR
jgi:hypothetical protein